jgi:hypothetical protein
MSSAFKPVITQAGITAVFNATNSGLEANIVSVALGDLGWEPSASATKLKREKRRVPVGNGDQLSPNQIHITAIEDGTQAGYWVREVGFYLEDGTLLAIWSHPTQPLAYKAPGVDLLLAFDIVLSALPANSINVIGNGTVNLAPATTTKLGVVRFSTDGEATAGSINNEVVTPRGVRLHGDARYARKSHRHPWSEIDGKPSAYPPSSHRHTWFQIDSKPKTYPPSSHNHDDRYLRLVNAPRAVYVDVRSTGNTSTASTALNWALAIHPSSGFRDNDHIQVRYKNRYVRGTGNGSAWWTDEYTTTFVRAGAWRAIATSTNGFWG